MNLTNSLQSWSSPARPVLLKQALAIKVKFFMLKIYLRYSVKLRMDHRHLFIFSLSQTRQCFLFFYALEHYCRHVTSITFLLNTLNTVLVWHIRWAILALMTYYYNHQAILFISVIWIELWIYYEYNTHCGSFRLLHILLCTSLITITF